MLCPTIDLMYLGNYFLCTSQEGRSARYSNWNIPQCILKQIHMKSIKYRWINTSSAFMKTSNLRLLQMHPFQRVVTISNNTVISANTIHFSSKNQIQPITVAGIVKLISSTLCGKQRIIRVKLKAYRNANYMYYKYKDYLLVIPSVEIGYSTYSIHMNSDLKQ